MPQEIELKLTLPTIEQRRFLRSPVLAKAGRSNQRLVNIYYDTPDLALQCSGIALRTRRSGRLWLQTVKCAGTSNGGLSSRPEWETPFRGEFDFSAVDDPTTRKRLERLKNRLVPIFDTTFLRTTWKIREAGAELIIALDRGNITANGKVESISEVEIELGNGQIDPIFSLAEKLAHHFSLTPGMWSKAERGYRLFLGTPQSPTRAAAVALDKTMSPVTAFVHVAHACLNHMQANREGILHSNDPEYIHQMRVAMRRLRAAMRLFQPILPAAFSEQLLPPLHALMQALGKARDLDVLTTEIVNPVIAAMPVEPRITALAGLITGHRETARSSAVQMLSVPDYGRLLLLALSQLHHLATHMVEDVALRKQSLGSFANARLKHLRRKVKKLAQQANADDPASLHALRISAKRLRYALEFLVPLLPARRTTALIKQLARVQNILGQLNDLASAGTVLMDCAADQPDLREAVSLIGGWHGPRYAALLAGVPKVLSNMQTIRPLKAS